MEAPHAIGNSLAEELAKRTRELERRTRQLIESEARFRNIIECNADAIVVVDALGLLRFANAEAAKLFGNRAEDLVGCPFGFPLVAGETTELDLLRPDGARAVEMRVVESQWEGQPAYIATLRDVTERQRAEQGARRLIREQAARSAAEEELHRFRFLAESGVVLSASLDYRRTMIELARVCVAELADWVVVYITDEATIPRRLEVAHRDPARAAAARELRESEIDESAANPVLETLRTRQPVLATRVGPAQFDAFVRGERQRALVRQLGLVSYMLVPMIARDRALGAIALVSATEERIYSAADLALAAELANRAALAIDNARLYQEARAANQTKSELLAVISHDLRTPLNSIIGYVQLLELGLPDPLPDRCREHVSRVHVSARHLLYLIDELLTYARVESGHNDVRAQEVDLNALLGEVDGLMEPLAHDRGLQLHVVPPPSRIRLHTDPDKLRQVLINLVMNALKFTPHGEIIVTASQQPHGDVVLDVRDTGIGIAPEHLAHLFEPFWQVDRSQRTNGGGTGLGLSIVERVVHQLGGTINVVSSPGEGSTFSVTLKVHSDES